MSKKQTKKAAIEPQMPEHVLLEIPINKLVLDNYRQEVDEKKLEVLAQSIRKDGLLQEPGVYPTEKGFQLIYGKRRTLAWISLGNETIRVKVYPNMTVQQAEELALIENCQREDPSDADTFIAVEKLFKNGHKSSAISKMLGRTELYVRRLLALTKLPVMLVEKFRSGDIDLVTASSIATMSPESLESLLKDMNEYPDMEIDQDTVGEYTRTASLDNARFDIKDAKLYPAMGSCTSCTFNTSANPILLDMYNEKKVCIHTSCFKKKEQLALIQEITAAPFGNKVIGYEDALNNESVQKMLIELGFTFVQVNEEDYIVVDPKTQKVEIGENGTEQECQAEAVISYLNAFVYGYLDYDEIMEDLENREDKKAVSKFHSAVKSFINMVNKLVETLPDVVIALVDDDFENLRYGINVSSHLIEIDKILDILNLKRKETGSESEDDDDDATVSPTYSNHREKQKQLAERYADPVAAEKIVTKIERNNQLMHEKLAEYFKKDAMKEFAGRLNAATDIEAQKELTDQESLALYVAMVHCAAGYDDVLFELYQAITGKESNDPVELGKLARTNVRFRHKLFLRFIYKQLLTDIYRVNPDVDENHPYFGINEAGYQAAISYEGIDATTIQVKTQELRDKYEKKQRSMETKLQALEKPAEAQIGEQV